MRKNTSWLETCIHINLEDEQTVSLEKQSCGRPSKDFLDSSERVKRRKTEELRTQYSSSELGFAAQMQLRAEGKLDAANIVKDAIFLDPSCASRYRNAYSQSLNSVIPYSTDQALSLFVEAKLTKYQYNLLRNSSKENNCKLYPNYESVTAAKKKCYPKNISISEVKAEFPLQDLLDHTISRIFEVQEDVFNTYSENVQSNSNLTLISKWGCDGSSGMSEYKQKFEDDGNSDASIFLASLVPIQLVSEKDVILWQNPRPSSPRFCRPIYMEYVHETTEIIKRVSGKIQEQKSTLEPSKIQFNGQNISIKHSLVFTMIDGKVVNAISENNCTQKCYLCGCTSKDFNKIDLILKKEVDKSKLEFGISSLHAWIRFLECVLHLSY
ncbi:unnamed protein product [Brassicogethes aeneus]|uniref:V(D)J recombination-activating protein 1 RNase H domain-containing protein n=1 Tax=Brassicogethes aeneus TaxID=1431903 RepID=A0A9P0AMZ0_BRAAE|nr:unnamed protein product [Brassicogethes aeneus]